MQLLRFSAGHLCIVLIFVLVVLCGFARVKGYCFIFDDASGKSIRHKLTRWRSINLFPVDLMITPFQLTVPPWPFYRLKPVKWQKARPDPDAPDSKSKKKK